MRLIAGKKWGNVLAISDVFSLQQSKQITCGDGGITLVNREDLVERATLFVRQGLGPASRTDSHVSRNELPNDRAASGLWARAQLKKTPKAGRAAT